MSQKRPPQDCQSYEATLSEWIFEDSVTEKRLAPLKGHLKTCESCRALKKEFESLKPLLSKEEFSPAPPGLKTRVMNQLIKPSKRRRPPVFVELLKVASVASLVGLILTGIFHHQKHQVMNTSFLAGEPSAKRPTLTPEKLSPASEQPNDFNSLFEETSPKTRHQVSGQSDESQVKSLASQNDWPLVKVSEAELTAFLKWCQKENLRPEKVLDPQEGLTLNWQANLSKENLDHFKIIEKRLSKTRRMLASPQTQETSASQKEDSWLYFELKIVGDSPSKN